MALVKCKKRDDGTLAWYKDGVLHRNGDRPALIRPDGTLIWYQKGMIHRDGGLPAIVEPDGGRKWLVNDRFHRDGDLPAIDCANGCRSWYKNGEKHRDEIYHSPTIFYHHRVQQCLSETFVTMYHSFLVPN